ncbi:MAG: thymidine phosphorylase [Bacilli bacterium]|nr:thymidine phosphorylase [Bacilli bacterium]MDD3304700.1 thymidine phosphorylase [Bacilli bacterium]MDD4053621.1 thymidine phosphorylase [Bacilli bacterium]MDD4411120.1 thymidine phosphorylase [Bacilli bacterium]
MNIVDIINKKRENQMLSYDELAYVIDGYMSDDIKDYQVSSLLMAICLNEMTSDEINNLTSIMLKSGDTFDLSFIKGTKVDKHSTGGVGDKTTLVVAPLASSCGLIIPKMSGRGLGHTGGTIDKLESIKGFNVNLSNDEFLTQLNEIGLAITTSSLNIVPADKKLYALRDVTGTVASLPLIASSIMSKKLAINADKIVLDVKMGNGALIKTKDEAIELAKIMINIGNNFGKETIALITNMNYPLGNSIGNGLEVREAIEILKGKGDNDFKQLCLALASYMVSIGKNIDIEQARKEVEINLDNGNAYNKFISMVNHQHGDINKIDISDKTLNYKVQMNGYINGIDTFALGKYVMSLGAGRETKEDIIDYGVGIVLQHKKGDYVKEGDILATVYVRDENISLEALNNIFIIEEEQKELEPIIYGVVK